MYLRFVTTRRDPWTRQLQGILTACYDLREEGELDRHARAELDELLSWYERNLTVPYAWVFREPAIAWFRADAGEPLQSVWWAVSFLRRHGLAVERLRTAKPGRVLYSDRHQVVAVPWRDTFRS